MTFEISKNYKTMNGEHTVVPLDLNFNGDILAKTVSLLDGHAQTVVYDDQLRFKGIWGSTDNHPLNAVEVEVEFKPIRA